MKKHWDRRFLLLAKHVAGWSKDRTKVGAVLAQGNIVLEVAYNGFAAGVKDKQSRLRHRDTKLKCTLHAEQNIFLRAGHRAQGATLYVWPLPPCSTCAALAIQAGIRRIVAQPPSSDLARRWEPSLRLARAMLAEAGVVLDLLPAEVTDG